MIIGIIFIQMKLTDKQRRITKRNSKLLINNTSTDEDYRYIYGKEIVQHLKNKIKLFRLSIKKNRT